VYGCLVAGLGTVGGEELSTGDAAKVVGPESLSIRADEVSELILVDVPMSFEPVGIWAGRI
jgi:hypothetical protein